MAENPNQAPPNNNSDSASEPNQSANSDAPAAASDSMESAHDVTEATVSSSVISQDESAPVTAAADTQNDRAIFSKQFKNDDLEAEIKAKAAKLGVKIEELLMLPMTHEDVLYLLNNCPYLQIVNSESNSDMKAIPELLEAQSGWVIYDYGDALCASPGDLIFADNLPDPPFLYGLGRRSGTDDDDTGGTGQGTILKQSVDTAAEMIFLAMQRAWPGVTIVEGHPRMKWAAWVMAGDHEYSLYGYEPSEAEIARRKRLRRSRAEIDEICLRVRKGMGANPSA